MARQQFFITGTDTDAGKTVVTAGLLTAANQRQLSTLAMKPVAAGCESTASGLRNDDALQLQAAMSIQMPYEQVNPVALAPAIAPHIAARQAGKHLQVSQLAGYCRGGQTHPADLFLVEGAGGWLVPLNQTETLADLARELQWPVILVVGMKLGCLNHALLTVQAIARDGLELAGWVANCKEPGMAEQEANIQTLQQVIPAPCLGVVPFLNPVTAGQVAAHLDIDLVISS